jgi:hypothetical protein
LTGTGFEHIGQVGTLYIQRVRENKVVNNRIDLYRKSEFGSFKLGHL